MSFLKWNQAGTRAISINAGDWTGGTGIIEREALIAHPRPPMQSSKLDRALVAPIVDDLAEYAEIAAAVGIAVPHLDVERFKLLLVALDLPIFSLAEVVSYMDRKAHAESKERAGWHWCPLRERDHRAIRFGTKAQAENRQYEPPHPLIPGSDYYEGATTVRYQDHTGKLAEYQTQRSSNPYDKTVPLHALKKVALIEKSYTGDVAFFVCDYALAPQVIMPDPFLMAVIPNDAVASGVGRFILDFWDEPGFGVAQQMTRA